MKILLITRCGCQQWMEIHEKYPPPNYKIPLPPTHVNLAKEYNQDGVVNVEVRVFGYMDSSKYGNFHVYKEI